MKNAPVMPPDNVSESGTLTFPSHVRNKQAFLNGIWDFNLLNPQLPNKCQFTDIDSITEINGRFLIIEFKSPNKDLPFGQLLMYLRLSELKVFTIIFCFGHQNKPEYACILTENGYSDMFKCDMKYLQFLIKTWGKEKTLNPKKLPVLLKK